jgi:hypothetical protein
MGGNRLRCRSTQAADCWHSDIPGGIGGSYIVGTLWEHSGNIQGRFREHSGNIQGTFREDSGNTQRTPGTLTYPGASAAPTTWPLGSVNYFILFWSKGRHARRTYLKRGQ